VTDLEQPRFHTIVEIRREIRNLVGEIDQLRLQRRPLIQEIFGEFRMLLYAVVARVLDDAFTNTERQIEPAVRGVTLLEVLDDTQCMEVVVEAPPMTAKTAVQCPLTGMPKGGMADVVDQCQRFSQIFIQAKRGRNRPGDLSDLNGVGQTAAKMIGGATGEYLRLPCEAPKGTGLHNALAVTLEGRTRGTEGRGIDACQKEIVRISGDRASMEIECHSQI
jgi:hypothetical protein